jgi:hypothetical protein
VRGRGRLRTHFCGFGFSCKSLINDGNWCSPTQALEPTFAGPFVLLYAGWATVPRNYGIGSNLRWSLVVIHYGYSRALFAG